MRWDALMAISGRRVRNNLLPKEAPGRELLQKFVSFLQSQPASTIQLSWVDPYT